MRDLNGLLAREQAIRQETEILRDANIALTENLSLERVLETLLDYLSKLVPYDSANVMLRDGQRFVVSALRRYEGYQDVETTRAVQKRIRLLNTSPRRPTTVLYHRGRGIAARSLLLAVVG